MTIILESCPLEGGKRVTQIQGRRKCGNWGIFYTFNIQYIGGNYAIFVKSHLISKDPHPRKIPSYTPEIGYAIAE